MSKHELAAKDMGCSASKSTRACDYLIYVKTGDVKGASTNANVFGSLYNVKGDKSQKIKLDVAWKNDFEQGQTDTFRITNLPDFGDIAKLEIQRDTSGLSDDWFVEKALVERCSDGKQFIFPINRWIPEHEPIVIAEFDCVLPQMDENKEQRKKELTVKQQHYQFSRKLEGFMAQIKECPADETFSNDYKWDLVTNKTKLFAKATIQKITTPHFKTLNDMESMYNKTFPQPYGLKNWKSDYEFGYQRLTGCNATSIRLCTEIPEKLAISEQDVSPFLENQALSDVIAKKKLYYIDYEILDNLACTSDRKIPAPIALFYVNRAGNLMPIAIQLEQLPSEDNPVFFPSDPENTWLIAKMFFNNADASFHQSAVHLGLTHLVMESIAVCTHRQLSPSHPLFRLMAPHFLFLIAINSRALEKLVSEGGWVDVCMGIGRIGMFNIVKRVWKSWRLDIHGTLPNDLKERGVDDEEALPNYHYRDDALLTYNIIKKYVTTVVEGVYPSAEHIANDYELQAWIKELVLTESEGGCHVLGVPDKMTCCQEISDVVTAILFMSSVGHAAANFNQYDEYAFPPNYPSILHGDRPTHKEPRTEGDIVKLLPDKKQFLDIMIVTKILSDRGTNALGDYEVNYAYDPLTTKALREFKRDCAKVADIIDKRNASRDVKYIYLSPAEVPNAISI